MTSVPTAGVQRGGAEGAARLGVFGPELQRDILLWLMSFGILTAFRVFMIWWYGSQMRSDGTAEVWRALTRGARFDSMVASYTVVLTLPFTALCLVKDIGALAQRVRLWVCRVAIGAHLAICGITVGYFKEYHDQFNQWIIGLITDDLWAIARTIWRGYPLLLYLGGYVLAVGLGAWGAGWLLRRFPPSKLAWKFQSPLMARIALVAACGVLFLAIRGWTVLRPMKQRDLAATSDPFLNKLVANPYIALRYAILDYQYVTGAKGLSVFLGGRNIVEAAKTVFPKAGSWTDLDELCHRTAKGRPGIKPKHIFLIVCESLDAWPSLPEYRGLGLADGLVSLATDGISCKAFVSAGFATIQAIGTLISGLPEAGVNVNYQPSSRTPFPTSSAPIFHRLGYRTRFIYGGFSWQRADEFALNQGYDEFQGLPSFKNLPPGGAGTWGAFDEYLFEHVLNNTPTNLPSFNLVLTTVNHPPYDCDVFARGFPHRRMPAPYDRIYDGSNPMKIYGHQWYTAKCVAEFVREGAKRFPESVFIITGDHPSRRFLNSHPPPYELRAVPCIIYGPEVLRDFKPPARMAGTHLDLVPTLVEMSAEKGFEYAAFGRDLLDATQEQVSFGEYTVVAPEFLLPIGPAEHLAAIPGEALPVPLPSSQELTQRYMSLHALSWWRVMKGSRLSETSRD